jgi:hypothetical protein
MAALLLAGVLGKGGVDLILLDARRGVAGLTEILLLGAITHHADMGVGLLRGFFWGGLAGHA